MDLIPTSEDGCSGWGKGPLGEIFEARRHTIHERSAEPFWVVLVNVKYTNCNQDKKYDDEEYPPTSIRPIRRMMLI